ncbi:MAG: hypothetical protein KGJ23_04695 [Euryarchaeota archaeon]|nr:hypothetical protein [Euryarchaeota archaeon]MDE1835897.1 hypothetical protein [Euryarchaeota archaeon]MDE1880228.1 hypothetical protein [Euryarchaeota archaeon]MDE2044425.1 hypothetical protein [Thermoplasmata archaeon]
MAGSAAPPGVEDPISAIFDLSDRVAAMAPTARRMYWANMVIALFWTFLTLIVLVTGLRTNAVLALIGFLGFGLGLFALYLLRETDRFFRGFVARHRTIRLVRDAEPIVKIPEGRTPIERLAHHFSTSNEKVGEALRENPDRLRYQKSWPVKGRDVKFDLAIAKPGGFRWGLTGGGNPGFVLLARVGPETVQLSDLQQMEVDLRAIAGRLPGRVARCVLLRPKGTPLSHEVYEYATGHPSVLRKGLHSYRVSTEIVTENPDGTYEFVPVVVGVP